MTYRTEYLLSKGPYIRFDILSLYADFTTAFCILQKPETWHAPLPTSTLPEKLKQLFCSTKLYLAEYLAHPAFPGLEICPLWKVCHQWLKQIKSGDAHRVDHHRRA